MTHEPTVVLPALYARWQERLAREFFADRRNQPVVMFVDRDELLRVSDPGEDGAHTLAAAVREVTDLSYGRSIFDRASRFEDQWRRSTRSQPPPTLPILALSVLAASEMQRDVAGAGHNYYVRLARVMLPDGSPDEIESLRDALGRRGAFAIVASMWQNIDRWLAFRDGEFGLSTIREDPDLTRVGFPQSQTLMRRSDRAAMTRLFARLEMDRRGVPTPEALLAHLRTWTRSRPQGFSAQFIRSLGDASVSPFLPPLLHGLAEAWDGKVITAEGLRRLDFCPVLDLDSAMSWWAIPSVKDVPGDVLAGSCDGAEFEARIEVDAYTSMYKTTGLPAMSPHALLHGLIAKGDHSVAEFTPSKMLVLEDSADAGGWIAVDFVQPYTSLAFVAAPDVALGVETAIADAADSGWSRMPQELADRILPDFAIFYDVKFSNPTTLKDSIKNLPTSSAAHISTKSTIRPRLINGLPLLKNLGRDLYLAGGEPDLDLPTGPAPEPVIVTLDGDRRQPFLPTIFPIPFRRFGPYDDGDHTIEALDERLVFTVKSGTGDERPPSGTGGLAWVDGHLTDAGAKNDACGAVVTHVADPDPALARRGMLETWLLHRTGRCVEVSEPPVPSFLAGASFVFFDLNPGDAVWLAQKSRIGWRIEGLKSAEPAFGNLSHTERLLWSKVINGVKSADTNWQLYQRAWAVLNGC